MFRSIAPSSAFHSKDSRKARISADRTVDKPKIQKLNIPKCNYRALPLYEFDHFCDDCKFPTSFSKSLKFDDQGRMFSCVCRFV